VKNYKQFNISAKPFNIDLLSGALWELEILGLNEFESNISIFVYEDSDVDKKHIGRVLDGLKIENLIQSYSVIEEIIENKNWNKEWEKKIKTIEVSDKIVITPSFREYKGNKDQIIITIDPKMSFGTGEHQTTQIMLQLLEKYNKTGNFVLDVGSGTSVLGITASKLGSKKIISVDNDEWCYINGLENAKKNEASNVNVLYGTIEEVFEKDFDLVLANINKNVLLEIKNELYTKVKNGGFLILSGILENDSEEIKRQFTQIGLTALETKQSDEWIGVVFQKSLSR